jgi:hypothetical protein
MRGDSTSLRVARNGRQLDAQEAQPLPYRNAALQQKGADLIDEAGALTDQSLADAVQCLQVKLSDGLCGDESHRWALHCLGDRLRVAIVVLLTFGIRADVFRRHQPSVVTKRLQLATEMMRADACLHADQAGRQIGEPGFHLTARPLLPQHKGSALILADEVERVLADIDADHGNCAIEFV